MSALISTLRNPYAVFTGWALLVMVWESAVVALTLAVWRLCRPRASAHLQYRAALLALFASAFLAAATPVLLGTHPVPSPIGSSAWTSVSRPVPHAPAPVDRRGVSAETGRESLARRVGADTIAGTAAVMWVLALGCLAVRFIGGLWLAREIVRTAAPVLDAGVRHGAPAAGGARLRHQRADSSIRRRSGALRRGRAPARLDSSDRCRGPAHPGASESVAGARVRAHHAPGLPGQPGPVGNRAGPVLQPSCALDVAAGPRNA